MQLQRRDFLGALTAGAVSKPTWPDEWSANHERDERGEPIIRNEAWDALIREYQNRAETFVDYASPVDLWFLTIVIDEFDRFSPVAEPEVGIASAFERALSREAGILRCPEPLVDQAAAVVDVLTALHRKNPEYATTPSGSQRLRDQTVAVVAAFCHRASDEQVKALGTAIGRHFARL